MKTFIRNLSAPAEFCLVILICFGLSIFGSVREAIGHLLHGPNPYPFSDGLVLWLVGFETAALTIVYWISRIRGWSFAMFGLRISWQGTGGGILLLIGTLVALTLQSVVFYFIHPVTGNPSPFAGTVTLPFAILLSLVNPVFEELMEVGYFVHVLKQYGMWPALLASACFRALLHIYGGVSLAAGILLLGLIFGCVYWKWRQLWPLILAHAIMDFVAMLRLMHAS